MFAGYAVVLVLVAGGIAMLVVIAMVIGAIGNGLSHTGQRRHLKAIPISTRACPYVALMHAAANDFQAHEPLLGLMFDANGRVLPIAKERTIIEPPLARFEFAIAIGKVHFPAAVRTQLAITQDAAHEGRARLVRASDPMALATSTSALLSKGQQAFGYASDLVGAQCGHGLGADSELGSDVVGPTTTTRATTTASRS